jgi:FkbM family methyltransferase
MNSFNQCGQEVWVRSMLSNKRNGFFLDIGAYDGVESSNTYYLEKELGWSGICIESNPNYFPKLQSTRSSICVNKAVMNYKGLASFNGINTYAHENGANSVECDFLHNILIENNSPKIIDYASFDIEGHEFSVLESFPFQIWNINLMTIEHNLYLVGDGPKNKIFNLLSSLGYARVVDNVCCPQGPYEDWYAKIQ